MPSALIHYITLYGYPTIFAFVFSQELGIPSPVPNELVLLFSGFLAFSGRLVLWKLLATVIAADCLGTISLYTVFYYFGPAIIKSAPKWLAISRIDVLKNKIQVGGGWRIYIARMIPYVRGYGSIAAGLMRLSPRIYVPAVVVTALVWSGGYVLIGLYAGPQWETAASFLGPYTILSILVFIIALILLGPIIYDRIKTKLQKSRATKK